MRVLLLDQFSEMGGAQQCLLDLAAGFRARGWELVAGLPSEGPFVAKLRSLGVQVELLPIPSYTAGRKTLRDVLRFAFGRSALRRRIQELAERARCDVIYVNGPLVLPAVPRGFPVVFHLHSHLAKQYAVSLTRRAIAATQAFVIGSSRSVLEPLANHNDATVIYNGVAEQAFRLPPDRPRVVSLIGRIAPGKGQLEFVRAARLLSGTDLEFRIRGAPMFAAEGYLRRVQAEAPETVQFEPWTDSIQDALHETDLLVVPSVGFESTPRVILEAFAAGTPVLAFPTGGIPELIQHGETGLLTKGHSAEQLAEGLRTCAELRSIAQAARIRWERDYTLDRFQAEVADVVCDVTGRRATNNRTSIAASSTNPAAVSNTEA